MSAKNSPSTSTPITDTARQKNNQHCIIIGHSIDAMTTATVLASMGNKVTLYADEQVLAVTRTTYNFEHQLQAFWQLYTSNQDIEIKSLPEQADVLFDRYQQSSISVYWVFYTDLPESWRLQVDSQEPWISALNNSEVNVQIPVVLSGITTLGAFANLANACMRPWVYYVPFVFLQDTQVYTSMLSPVIWLMGEKTPDSSAKVFALHPFIAQAKHSYITDIATVEFARSAIMSMLATRVSFMNEWSRLADYQGVDITEVAAIMGLDKRIGKSYLKAGWGFGGRTLPTEIAALQDTLVGTQVDHQLIKAVYDINEDQKELVFRKFWQYFDGAIEGKVVTIWGASYKSGSGRTTESAIHPLLRLLWSYRITTYVYAGEAEAELARLYPNQPLLKFIDDATTPLTLSSALFVLEWSDTKRLPLVTINEVVIPIFDASNVFTNDDIQQLKGDYVGIGRSK